jgi:two-component system, NarL family, nitrate/nitrite response regulator NarL
MNVVILTPVRLFGQGLAAVLDSRQEVRVQGLAADFAGLRATLTADTRIVLIDVTQGIAVEEVRALAAERPDLKLIALGLKEQQQEVVSCGRSGFCDYVAREASIDALVERIRHAVAGRLACSAEMASALMRGLFRPEVEAAPDVELTVRQSQVAHLLERGLSNKEMARELDLSVGTVKHHVHGDFDRLGVNRRSQAMRIVRNAPWRF